MRDTIVTNKDYFTHFIDQKKSLIKGSLGRINDENFDRKNVPTSRFFIFLYSLQILIAKYSRGDAIESLYPDYSYCIENLEKDWDDSIVKFKKGGKVYDQYYLNNYMVWMLSFAILLQVPKNEIAVLKKKNMDANIKDELIIFLLNALTPVQVDQIEPTHTNPFKHLTKGGIEGADSARLIRYMSSWHKNTRLHTWHFYKNSIGRKYSYFGYWSFEAAAVTAIQNIDDSSYRNHPYYPKDLVDFFRHKK